MRNIEITSPLVAFIASGVLRDREPHSYERKALELLGNVALDGFDTEDSTAYAGCEAAYHSTSYWHGTGRYQHRGDRKFDVLQHIVSSGVIKPSLDYFDMCKPRSSTTSLSPVRLYARAYADAHDSRPNQDRRFVSSFAAVHFFAVRSILSHRYREVTQHKDGMILGGRSLYVRLHERNARMSIPWRNKVHQGLRHDILAFKSSSDILDNYPILFGVDSTISLERTSEVIKETREVCTSQTIPLDAITHIEVPARNISETETLLTEIASNIPIFSLEAMEDYISKKPITEVMLGKQDPTVF